LGYLGILGEFVFENCGDYQKKFSTLEDLGLEIK